MADATKTAAGGGRIVPRSATAGGGAVRQRRSAGSGATNRTRSTPGGAGSHKDFPNKNMVLFGFSHSQNSKSTKNIGNCGFIGPSNYFFIILRIYKFPRSLITSHILLSSYWSQLPAVIIIGRVLYLLHSILS